MNRIGSSKEARLYSVIYSPENLDIAILGPAEHKRSFSEYDVSVAYIEDIATFAEISIGQSVYVAGYPFKIGADGNILNPVVQNGIIAFTDTTNALVLVDISINLGNSGCPAITITKDGKAKLMGLVFAYEPSKEDIVFRTTSQTPVPLNTGLGRIVLLHPIIDELRRLPH